MVKAIIFAAIALAFGAHAQQAEYAQCGGIGWTGQTTCVSPYVCTVINSYYYQCLPGTSSATTATTSTTKTTTTTSKPTSSTTASVSKPSTTTTTTTSSKPTTTSSPTKTTATTTTTGSAPAASGTEIRADQSPVYHFYLQNLAGAAVLGSETGDGLFVINGSIYDTTTGLYLNIGASTGASYYPLTFGSTATFTGWALEGDTIITAQTSSFGRQLNFLVCETSNTAIWSVYLQTGSDVPSGQTCTDYISLHLPCLCSTT